MWQDLPKMAVFPNFIVKMPPPKSVKFSTIFGGAILSGFRTKPGFFFQMQPHCLWEYTSVRSSLQPCSFLSHSLEPASCIPLTMASPWPMLSWRSPVSFRLADGIPPALAKPCQPLCLFRGEVPKGHGRSSRI